MDDRAVALLQEIRDLLQQTVHNQERVLRANDESMHLYRAAARRQTIGIVVALVLLAAVYVVFLSR